jgi:dimethylargininase
MPTALVREVPSSFADCVTTQLAPIDVGVAREQHLEYRARLREGGFEVEVVIASADHPDSVFIEDVAVVIGGRVLATRPGHPSRRGEVGPVAAVLAGRFPVTTMTAPASLDGGDVLRMGPTVFVGRSERTNSAGIDTLRRFASPMGCEVVPVDVGEVLHLKSGAAALDDRTVLVARGVVDDDRLGEYELVALVGDDAHAANVVRLPDGSILVASAYPEAAEQISDLGYPVVRCDVSEFGKADGGLTCLSIRIRNR